MQRQLLVCQQLRHPIQVGVKRVVLPALFGYLSISFGTLLRNLPILVRTLLCDMQLAVSLLRVEPEAACCDHGRDNQELRPVPERDLVVVAYSDQNTQDNNDSDSPEALPWGRSPVGHQQA